MIELKNVTKDYDGHLALRNLNLTIQNGEIVGHVTSGTVAPTVGKNLGMALVRADLGPVGTEIAIDIREKPIRAQTISRPFYKRGK